MSEYIEQDNKEQLNAAFRGSEYKNEKLRIFLNWAGARKLGQDFALNLFDICTHQTEATQGQFARKRGSEVKIITIFKYTYIKKYVLCPTFQLSTDMPPGIS